MSAAIQVFRFAAAFVACALACQAAASAETNRRTGVVTNRLITSDDPYLRQHAHNPVDWYPWGPEAFAKAKAEGKPIFLSIGYSTCFWCHVAEKTIYSDPAIARLMNLWFVNIKVDREQRPDVDQLYIAATEMLTGHGAWPNNLFLTPDGKPFYAGSYFPPKNGPEGEVGFPTVLAAIHDLWTNHRADKVEPAVAEIFGALKKVAAMQRAVPPVPLTPEIWLKEASQRILLGYDPVNGGFGSPKAGPKFPQAPALDLLLAATTQAKDDAARRALTKTLEAMAYGGIDDQIGGGFHRYATEPTWTIPHFEKMLSDNAQLLSLYTRAYPPTRTPFFRDVALHIGRYLIRDMQAPDGGFYTAQDAEVAGVEGANYLWTRAEVADELGPVDTERFFAVYEIVPMPDIPPPGGLGHGIAKRPGAGVLRVRLPIEETVRRVGATDLVSMQNALAPLRAELLSLRKDRPQPATDEKIVTSLNGLAISALARAGAELEQPDLAAAAKKAAVRIWSVSYEPVSGLVRHEIIHGRAGIDGYLDDYAMLAGGFLTLADAIHDDAKETESWRRRAAVIADAMLARFAAPDGGLAAGEGDGLPIALAEESDDTIASGPSAALEVLLRLGEQRDGERFRKAAARLAEAMSGRIAARPQAWPSAVAALARHPLGPAVLAASTPAARAMAATADGIPSTSDHVHVSARVVGDTIAVTLKVDAGYHVNAHTPSFDYLVPTSVSFGPLRPATIAYPKPMRFKSAFAPDGLDVYEGEVALVARFPARVLSGVAGLSGEVTTQACDAKTCLPPATLSLHIANPG